MNGGGIRVSDNSIVRNCIISNNVASSDDVRPGHGGGEFLLQKVIRLLLTAQSLITALIDKVEVLYVVIVERQQ